MRKIWDICTRALARAGIVLLRHRSTLHGALPQQRKCGEGWKQHVYVCARLSPSSGI